MLGNLEVITRFFPELDEEQVERFRALAPLYEEWNGKINVISRRDVGNLYEHHVLHSLALAKFLNEITTDVEGKGKFNVLDVGTGGGFPGIPLAILFPEYRFTLIDSVRKKIRVCQAVVDALGLHNVRSLWQNVMDHTGRYSFIVSRAVTTATSLHGLVSHLKGRKTILCLKGGDMRNDIAELQGLGIEQVGEQDIHEYFPLPYFEGKKILYWQA